MIDFLLRVFWEIWNILKEASVFLLFGFFLAGVLAELVPTRMLSKLFGSGKIKSVLWGAAVGAPLPLCSCGVLPTAIGLRRQGATPGATVSFLIATPETGVDSISLTYALMDPLITVFRPLAAVITAVSAGLLTNFVGIPRVPARAPSHTVAEQASPRDDCCDDHHDHDEDHDLSRQLNGAVGNAFERFDPRRALRQILRYAFRQLLDETSYWLVLGVVLSGIVAALIPSHFFEQYFNHEVSSMLVMLGIGIPIYTCASASTPLAAALVIKGLNPGAALVFLLSGPATNLGSIVVLFKFLGARIVAIYLTAIVVTTLAAGFALNALYRWWNLDPKVSFGQATTGLPDSVKVAGAIVLIALLISSLWRAHVPGEWIWLRDRVLRLSRVKGGSR